MTLKDFVPDDRMLNCRVNLQSTSLLTFFSPHTHTLTLPTPCDLLDEGLPCHNEYKIAVYLSATVSTCIKIFLYYSPLQHARTNAHPMATALFPYP